MAGHPSVPGLHVVRGNPDEAELAAVVCVLLARLNRPGAEAEAAAPGARAAWRHAPQPPHCAASWRAAPTAPS